MIEYVRRLVQQLSRCLDSIAIDIHEDSIREELDQLNDRIVRLSEQLHYERLKTWQDQRESSVENRCDGANSASRSIGISEEHRSETVSASERSTP